jgi:transposase
VITVGILAKIRRMYFREKVLLREIARRTGLSRNTVRSWLRQTDAVEPKYSKRVSPSVVAEWAAQLTGWLRADSHRPKRDRRTARFMFEAIRGETRDSGPRPISRMRPSSLKRNTHERAPLSAICR